MSPPSNPTQKVPERASVLQEYLLLHSQHDVLRKHLDSITTSPTPPAPASSSPDRYNHHHHQHHNHHHHHRHSSLSSSLSSSPASGSGSGSGLGEHLASSPPTRNHHRSRSSLFPARPPMLKRQSSLPTVLGEEIQTQLKDVNLRIKSTLSELLNCGSVREDRACRMWVQRRLMDAEMELRGDRRWGCERRRKGIDNS